MTISPAVIQNSRHVEAAAFDALPAEIRRAIASSVNDWNAVEVAAHFAKHGVQKTISWLRRRDSELMRGTGFYVGPTLVFSTYSALKLKPLRAA